MLSDVTLEDMGSSRNYVRMKESQKRDTVRWVAFNGDLSGTQTSTFGWCNLKRYIIQMSVYNTGLWYISVQFCTG